VKLLFEQNLSPRLPARLADRFPGSDHVDPLGLAAVDDAEVWEFALRGGFAMVTKDEDFGQMGVLRGSPPKVLWLLLGNCSTAQVEALLRDRFADIMAFDCDPNVGVLALG